MIELERRAALIAGGAAQWRDRASPVRIEARESLRESGWSAPVIEAALDNVLWDLDETKAASVTREFSADAKTPPILVILPGNIIGPAVATAYCAAAAGSRIILKSPGTERSLAPIVQRQFNALGRPLAGTLEARYWNGGDAEVEDALYEPESIRYIVVLGSDETIEAVRQRATVPVIGYGTSYSLGYVANGADLSAAAAGAARDICMFDQRGCMSPQTIYVQGDDGRALRFAHALAAALRRVGEELPRARVDAGEAAAVADRIRRFAVTALPPRTHGLDTLLLGPERERCPEFVVAVEPPGLPTCEYFGRIVSVKPCETFPGVAHAPACDTVGIAGCPLDALQRRWVRTCALGDMQRPPFGYRPTIDNF